METRISKTQILAAGLTAQAALIDDFKTRIAELRSTGEQYANDQHDSGAQSMSQDTEDQAALMGEQLIMLVDEMDKLNRIQADEIHDVVHLGSVVVTKEQRFFVSVSLERFKVNEVDFFGVSTQAPIYKAMEGKCNGDLFEVNGRSFKILDLY